MLNVSTSSGGSQKDVRYANKNAGDRSYKPGKLFDLNTLKVQNRQSDDKMAFLLALKEYFFLAFSRNIVHCYLQAFVGYEEAFTRRINAC